MTDVRQDLARATSAGASIMMSSAVAQRVISFLLNFALLQFVSSEVVGFAEVNMGVYLGSILFVSRESVRLVTSRFPAQLLQSSGRELDAFVRLAWLPVLFGTLLLLSSFVVSNAYSLYMVGGSGAADVSAWDWLPSSASDERMSILIYTLCSGGGV